MAVCGNYILVDSNDIDDIENDISLLFDERFEDVLFDIDRTFDIINFIMRNGFNNYSILEKLVFNGYYIDKEDKELLANIKYIDDVKQIYNIIKNISKEEFKEKYNSNIKIMNESEDLYPKCNYNDIFEFVFESFEIIKKVYKLAYEQNKNIIFFLS